MGVFDPDSTSTRWRKAICALLVLVATAIVTIHIFALLRFGVCLSPDSWTILELSKTINHDFFSITTLRDLSSRAPDAVQYSRSMQPVLPILTHAMAGVSPYPSIVVNVVLFAALMWSSNKIVVACGVSNNCMRWAVSYFASCGHYTLIEVFRGNSAVPALLFFSLTVLAFLTVKSWGICLAGVTAALAYLSRFDALLPILLFASLVLVSEWKSGSSAKAVGIRGFCFALAFTAVTLPYASFQNQKFGSWITNESVQVAASVESMYITDYVPSKRNTGDNLNSQLINKTSNNIMPVAKAFAWALLSPPTLGVLLLGLYALFKRDPLNHPHQVKSSTVLTCATIGTLGVVPGLILTGYAEPRYFIYLSYFASLNSLWLFSYLMQSRQIIRRSLAVFACSGVVSILFFGVSYIRSYMREAEAELIRSSQASQIAQGLTSSATYAPTLLEWHDSDNPGLNIAHEIGAIYGIRSVPMPRNLLKLGFDSVRDMITNYHVTHVAVSRGSSRILLKGLIGDQVLRTSHYDVFKTNQ